MRERKALSVHDIKFIDWYQVGGFGDAREAAKKAGIEASDTSVWRMMKRRAIADEIAVRKRNNSPEEAVYRLKMLKLQEIVDDPESKPSEVISAIKTMSHIDGDMKREREENQAEAPTISFTSHTAK